VTTHSRRAWKECQPARSPARQRGRPSEDRRGRRTASPFGVVLVDDLARVSRDLVETKNPETAKRTAVARPPADWIVEPRAELRLIDPDR
jgi:hypothetical protein